MKPVEVDDAFFHGKVILLVEDELTRRVVSKCWEAAPRAKDIQVRAAGGSDGVAKLVEGIRQRGRTDVFGLVDRDFGMAGPGSGPVFRTGWHECENHLLDFDVLAKIAERATRDEIAAKTLDFARTMKTWMALRCALSGLRRDRPEFPGDPEIAEIPTIDEARRWFEQQRYPEAMGRWVRAKWTTAQLVTMCDQHDRDYENDLSSGPGSRPSRARSSSRTWRGASSGATQSRATRSSRSRSPSVGIGRGVLRHSWTPSATQRSPGFEREVGAGALVRGDV